jgi:transport and Golgi organization protein 2
MCTVVCEWSAGELPQILALRDEFVGREFDDPGTWWPDQPTLVGGRDRVAGGSWCVTDVTSGVTALVVNRFERRDGAPSRGVLPLVAAAHGVRWNDAIDIAGMASFNLALLDGSGVVVWKWDGTELRRTDLAPGLHLITSPGVDADDPKTARFGRQFAQRPWLDVVTSTEPSDDSSALILRRALGGQTYATVFGQQILARPGTLTIRHSRTPWRAGTWVEQSWSR